MRIIKKEKRQILIEENHRLAQQVKELELRVQRAEAAEAQAKEELRHASVASDPQRGVS